MVGLDVLAHVVRNANERCAGGRASGDERGDLGLPAFYDQMLERKLLGDKTRRGFYKKDKRREGDKRLALDWKTLEYRPAARPKFPSLEMAKTVDSLGERLRMLTGMGAEKVDKAGEFLWTALSEAFTYAANRIPEISDNVVEIDRAMRMGFNWELGPFEMWDAIGVATRRAHEEGRQAGRGQRGEAAGRWTHRAGTATLRRPPVGARTLTWPRQVERRRRSPPACGASRWRRNPMEW